MNYGERSPMTYDSFGVELGVAIGVTNVNVPDLAGDGRSEDEAKGCC